MNTTFIAPEIVEKINDVSKIEDVIANFVTLKPQGSALIGTCTKCGNSNKKLNVSPTKKIWKCFTCERGGNTAVSYLMKMEDMEYPLALEYLAGMYTIDLTPDTGSKKKRRSSRKVLFRDTQLKASGLSTRDQKYSFTKGDKAYKLERYTTGSIDTAWNIVAGDDMILHYVNLDYSPMQYNKNGTNKTFIRIRYANPALHLSKKGKEMKYGQPYGSGQKLWYPNWLIEAYQGEQVIETLYLTEGEKKADKMCKEGMMAIGISGIHNFSSTGEMPHEFERIIRKCAVQNVVFVLDADWQDISIKPNQSIDLRPRTFMAAIQKFVQYFRGYKNENIYLNLFFAYGKDVTYKGIDDLMVRGLNKKTSLKEDFEKAIIDRNGVGEHIEVKNVTLVSGYKIAEFWNLHAKQEFFKKHKEELKKLPEFIFRKVSYRYNEDEDDFELCQAIMPYEQYWEEKIRYDKKGNEHNQINFEYRAVRFFLRNRGFHTYQALGDNYRFIHVKNKVVEEVDHNVIQDYIIDFSEEIEKKEVVKMLLQGCRQYLGPDKLSRMFKFKPEFIAQEKESQYLFFKNCYWKITAEKIVQKPLSELPGYIWKDQIIDFDATYLKNPVVQIDRKNDNFGIKLSPEAKKSDIVNYFIRTSWFSWQKKQELKKQEDGKIKWVPKDEPEPETKEDIKLTTINMVGKMLSAGYVLHEYMDYSNTKAIVCMDGLESEVGKSQGGTGKSIFGKIFAHLQPSVIIDGKDKDPEGNKNIFEEVDERTRTVVFDDIKINFNFAWLFSKITTGLTVDGKYMKTFKVRPPKFILTTNHALRGDDDSHDRRQYIISFSNYYNKQRTIYDDFGRQLFHEWDNDQWNLFYNFMANCIQTYLKFGLKYTVPQDALKRRKIRQDIGDNFIEFALLYFHTSEDEDGHKGRMLNNKIEMTFLLNKYLDKYPADRRWVNSKKIKEKLKKYAAYAKLDFNLPKDGARIMSNSKEFIILSDSEFNAVEIKPITSDAELIDNYYN